MAKSVISTVIERFVEVYPTISTYHNLLDRAAVLKRINSGDCGTASLCIGKHLSELGLEVKFVSLDQGPSGHAVIEIDDKWYDTDNPLGVPKQPSALKRFNFDDAKCEITYMEYKDHLDAWVHHTDDLGLLMLETFPVCMETAA